MKSQGSSILPSVNETYIENSPFPPTPFLYLAQHGAHAADSAFADDLVFSDDGYYTGKPRPKGLSQSSQFDGSTTTREKEHLQRRLCRSGSVAAENGHEILEPLEEKSKSAEVSPSEGPLPASVKAGLLQRSVSEITKRTGNFADGDDNDGDNDEGDEEDDTQHSDQGTRNYRVMIGRRRNNSGGIADGGMSLLKHLSSSMSHLIQTIHKPSVQGTVPVNKTFQRPIMAFVMQRHDLDSLQLGMKQALRKVTCRVFALQAFNWLTRSVSQPTCLHDLFWCFTASLTPFPSDDDDEDESADKKISEKKEIEQDKEVVICEHPLSDITIAGQAVRPLQDTFHMFLQSVSDVMMYLPPGSALQQMAVRCWCLAFRPSDHLFLHKSHVFSNISKILSKSDEGWGVASVHIDVNKVTAQVECLNDLTNLVDIRSSSRQAMIGSLTDNSTETFWESGDDDRNKPKSFILTLDKNVIANMICVHVDNSRDLANKVTSIAFHGGVSADELPLLKQFDLEVRHSGWVCCSVSSKPMTIFKLEMKGPDNTLRVRQIKMLGGIKGASLAVGKQQTPLVMQQKACEAETLKVFRLLTSEVFGKLISDGSDTPDDRDKSVQMAASAGGPSVASDVEQNDGELDLKEHMVGILFSRSKLTHLQKQVCAHIVQAIRKETIRVQEEWEDQLQTEHPIIDSTTKSSDAYCFELLSMVLALSGSAVGRNYLARQHSLLQDMLSLMHTSTPRVQRQVLALLRRVLPEVPPQILAELLGVESLPPEDISILCANSDSASLTAFDIHRQGILDVFLSCIAKAITVQMKIKGQSSARGTQMAFKLSDSLPSNTVSPNRWWLRGSSSSQMAEATITLLKDLASGKLSESWAAVTKSAVAENILALTKLDETLRQSSECIKTPTLWLALASLCVLEKEHVARLSSGHWVKGEENIPRPTCDNHDDGETPAIILCNDCGNLCGDCDRFLHLHRKTRSHTRQVFKEEKKAIRVDLHEGCGRTKLFWIMALADSRTLKAVIEFREGSKGKFGDSTSSTETTGTCRFCGTSANTGLLAIGNVCSQPECQEFARTSCSKTLPCGHQCGGIAGEDPCLPCLFGCIKHNQERLKQDADDMCMICFTDALSAAPAIQLTCGHVFHLHCCRNVLERRWVGPRITFGFSLCPICKASIDNPVLKSLLDPIRQLYEDVRRKALMRLEYEGLDKSEAIVTQGTRFHKDPAGYAMERYAYYVCYKCKKAYYGGEARCEEQAAAAEDYNPAELVCGACSDVSRAQMCPKHGTDFLEYKCRYCCSVAVFFCFGTTHFCNACHDDFQRVTSIPKNELPHCPAGPKARQLEGEECPLHIQHPPTGEEFALGCGVCRNAHTF
ncbi:hypothetical protein LSH36_84g08056 [Paralvinella palmiformis]|uniref:RCR-type E3 ubiquitin transferase n=1 Tax=Paralvinella palmiformis TaxID=53620 RepID=A0AAD9NC61_9ANNE|nr:hypothetical protein LSH36_84g08056 [Paralvinella palmiformis]